MKSDGLDKIIERIERLEKAVFGDSIAIKKISKRSKVKIGKAVFSLNERAFVKRYAADKSGPKKFTLVLAHLAKGDTGRELERKVIETLWKKMSGKQLLGDFNGFYANEAKNQGLVNSKKRGFYSLSDEWEKALES